MLGRHVGKECSSWMQFPSISVNKIERERGVILKKKTSLEMIIQNQLEVCKNRGGGPAHQTHLSASVD